MRIDIVIFKTSNIDALYTIIFTIFEISKIDIKIIAILVVEMIFTLFTYSLNSILV